eukprot:CAMPEP_0179056992 /NCGR_PEP_ID=MMETSP0796-20121207/24100_1 /TAXON_ID=73915 /ORGANISM="Pyrodinium bahamense, Strain pbaha01" /LENGTH=603 /DNA_ID=CAMNT_0020753689 /DNA_START=97 /DNA_END=1908 /DNA_ORIENTATION=+
MPARRPAPLSDELFAPNPVLLGATNNGMPLAVKNTFLDMPSGLTPASMKHEKVSKGMFSAPADFNNDRSPGFLRRALVLGTCAATPAESASEEASFDEALPPAIAPSLGAHDHDGDSGSPRSSFCTPPATPAIVASLFQSPGVTPAASSIGQFAALELVARSPTRTVLPQSQPQSFAAATVAGYASLPWGPLTYALTPSSARATGMQEQASPESQPQPPSPPLAAVPLPGAPPVVVPEAPAHAPRHMQAPAEKLLLLEEALCSKRLTGTLDTSRTGAAGSAQPSPGTLTDAADEDEEEEDSEEESEAALQPIARAPEDVPKPPPGASHPSIGSELHAAGSCKRCCFFPRGRCMNGYECSFCHYEHDKRKRKNKKKRTKATSSAVTLAVAGESEDAGVAPSACVPAAALEDQGAPAPGTVVAPLPVGTMPGAMPCTTSQAASQQSYMAYYQATEATLSPASMLTGCTGGASTGAATGAFGGASAVGQHGFFMYGVHGQSEPGASYQVVGALAEVLVDGYGHQPHQLAAGQCLPPLLSTTCGSSGLVAPLHMQATMPPTASQAMQGVAPPPMQSPRLQEGFGEFTPPPPMQSPKLPCDPSLALVR